MSADTLELKKATIQFGGLRAVSDLDFCLGTGELMGLIGPNGAGKTTVFNLITGVYQPTSGQVLFSGQSLAGRNPNQICDQGISRTFQNIRLFGSMTVLENVRTALQVRRRQKPLQALWRGPSFHQAERETEAQALELLEIFSLHELSDELAKSLPYGDQRRLEIVRALATRPKLLLLDEPAAGMNPTEKAELTRLIRFIKERFQISILLVEHDMRVVMEICERILVLDYGEKIAEGTPDHVRNHPDVIEAYLGAPATSAHPPASSHA